MQVLGINFSIDAAAALIQGGRLVAAAREERFSRLKHDRGFPNRAIDFCLKRAGIDVEQLDAVAFFWNPGTHAEPLQGAMSATLRNHLEYLYNVPNHLLQRFNGRGVDRVEQILHLAGGKSLPIYYLDHHLCHAASALFLSPFQEAALLTVDGYGERTSTRISHGRGLEIEPLLSVDFPHSLGSFYAAFTQYLGFRANNGEGKVMGLASYGTASLLDAIEPMLRLNDDGFEVDLSFFSYHQMRTRRFAPKLERLLGPERERDEPPTQRHFDIAHAVQLTLERALLHLARLAAERSGSQNLALAGGVALNCVANGRLLDEAPFSNYFFVPAAGDDGSAVGAALWVTHGLHGLPRTERPNHDYHGPEYTNDEIELALNRGGLDYTRVADVSEHAARSLVDGKIIGWFQGRMELGPRALGNRSILADPRSAAMKDTINARVKFREPFRPFAPAILEERCAEFFSCATPSPYMLRVYQTLPHKVAELQAVTHVDGGARVQTVNRTQNQRYYDLIAEFGRLTGVPVVLNTSFNIRGEPIICTPEDALKCFFTTGLDRLYIGDFLVEKRSSGS